MLRVWGHMRGMWGLGLGFRVRGSVSHMRGMWGLRLGFRVRGSVSHRRGTWGLGLGFRVRGLVSHRRARGGRRAIHLGVGRKGPDLLIGADGPEAVPHASMLWLGGCGEQRHVPCLAERSRLEQLLHLVYGERSSHVPGECV